MTNTEASLDSRIKQILQSTFFDNIWYESERNEQVMMREADKAKAALKDLIAKEVLAELEALEAQKESEEYESELFPGSFIITYKLPMNILWNRRDELKRQLQQQLNTLSATKGSEEV